LTLTSGAVPLDPGDGRAVATIAALHAELLPTSPLARLGVPFLEHFYYRGPVAAGLLAAFVARDDATPAGFIACTAAADFSQRLVREHRVGFAVALARSLVTAPRRAGDLLRLSRATRARGPAAPANATGGPESAGELLSLGVREAFRTREYLRRTHRRLSFELLDAALRHLRAAGCNRFAGYVEAANQPTLLMYQGLGCQLTPVAGLPNIRVEGAIDEALEVIAGSAPRR
jgi:ribosomal protein S18 acetylase RimI-like enzyme